MFLDLQSYEPRGPRFRFAADAKGPFALVNRQRCWFSKTFPTIR